MEPADQTCALRRFDVRRQGVRIKLLELVFDVSLDGQKKKILHAGACKGAITPDTLVELGHSINTSLPLCLVDACCTRDAKGAQ